MDRKVARVLVASGNQAIFNTANDGDMPFTLTNNAISYTLANGQLGVFKYNNNKALANGDTIQDANEIYIAAGTSDGMTDSLRIDGKFIKRATKAVCSDGQPKVIHILFDCAKCDTEYTLRVRSWSETSDEQFGWTPNYSTYNVKTASCCDDCETTASCTTLAQDFVDKINNNYYSCVTAALLEGEDLGDYNCGISLTGKTPNQGCTCLSDLNYNKLVGVNFEVGLVTGFDCCGEQSTIDELKYPQGSGYSIRRRESDAAGYSQGLLYRQSNDAWLYLPTTYADCDEGYTQYIIEHDDKHNGLATEHYHERPLTTIIAIPCTDTTTISQFEALMNTYMESTPNGVAFETTI